MSNPLQWDEKVHYITTPDNVSEVRVFQSGASDTQFGTKNDDDKLRMDLVPPEAVEALADILTFGAKKYGDRNWEKGISYGRLFAATLRHLYAWARGEDNDPESGKSHLKHALCTLAMLVAYADRGMSQWDYRGKNG